MRAWAILSDVDGPDGRVVELDAADGAARPVLVHRPPARLRVDGKGLTGACRVGGALYLCGGAAVYRFDAALRPDGVLAAPHFNDLHAVTHVDDRLYIVNTGLDAVDVFDLDGAFIGTHGFEMAWLTARRLAGDCPRRDDHARLHRRGWHLDAPDDFDPDPLDGYYRGGDRPFAQRRQRDYVHPNHLCADGPRRWVTCLAPRAIVDLNTHRAVCHVDAPPHDGQIVDGALWLTRVDGVVESRALDDPRQIVARVDASAASDLYGWCRGLLVDGPRLWVGFTAIHHPPRYRWDRVDPSRTRTGVACLDRATGRLVARFDLGAHGVNPKLYALIATP